jgi:hypothetical protein
MLEIARQLLFNFLPTRCHNRLHFAQLTKRRVYDIFRQVTPDSFILIQTA